MYQIALVAFSGSVQREAMQVVSTRVGGGGVGMRSPVPREVVHLIVEQEYGWPRGLWGSVSGGATA